MIHEIIGYVSMISLLFALAFRKRKFIGSIFNIIGGLLMVYYALTMLPVAILNSIWTIISVIQLIKELRK